MTSSSSAAAAVDDDDDVSCWRLNGLPITSILGNATFIVHGNGR